MLPDLFFGRVSESSLEGEWAACGQPVHLSKSPLENEPLFFELERMDRFELLSFSMTPSVAKRKSARLQPQRSLAIWLGRCEATGEHILAKANNVSLIKSRTITRLSLELWRDAVPER